MGGTASLSGPQVQATMFSQYQGAKPKPQSPPYSSCLSGSQRSCLGLVPS